MGQYRPKQKKESIVSAHIMFIYSVLCPGLGEYSVKSGTRWKITAVLLAVLFVSLNWMLVNITLESVEFIVDSKYGQGNFSFSTAESILLGVSIFGLYYVWLWSIFSSIMLAKDKRKKLGEPVENSRVWGAAMAWLCPGAGHAYGGATNRGLIFMVAYGAGMLLIIPDYATAFAEIRQYIAGINISGADLSGDGLLSFAKQMEGLSDQVAIARFKLEYSVGAVIRLAILVIAAAETVSLLCRDIEEPCISADTKTILGVMFIGWVCPGGAQLAMKREKSGWTIVFSYILLYLLIGFLINSKSVSHETATSFALIPALLKWGGIIEAAVRLYKRGDLEQYFEDDSGEVLKSEALQENSENNGRNDSKDY